MRSYHFITTEIMKAKIRTMTEKMTAALGPVFYEFPDYSDIQQAIGLVVARIAQSTPVKGFEQESLDTITNYANKALPQFLDAEQTIQEAKAKVLVKGIDGFAELAKPVEPGGISDYPSSNAEVAKFSQPFPSENTAEGGPEVEEEPGEVDPAKDTGN